MCIEYCLRNDIIPVVDMQNRLNIYHTDMNEVGKVNTWECFFEQPNSIKLEEAIQSNSYNFSDPDWVDYLSINYIFDNPEIYEYYQWIASKYIRFNSNAESYLNDTLCKIKEKQNFLNERTIGVIARGTDFTSCKPAGHAIQPTIEQLIQKTEELKRKHCCEKIYLATEDEDILAAYKKMYGNDVFAIDQRRTKCVNTWLAYDKEFMRGNGYQRGMEYLLAVFLLTKCNGIIGSKCSGLNGALLMPNSYEFSYIFNLGTYGSTTIQDSLNYWNGIKNGK